MICLNAEKKFSDETESLVKAQIDNSIEFGWKKEDIVLLTNFQYEYQGITATVIDVVSRADAILYLLEQGVVQEAELWWAHDINVFQRRPMKSSDIDLDGTTAGFTGSDTGMFEMGSFFFRKDANKVFEWIRNRARRRRSDEATALASLSTTNYRNINSMYAKLNFTLAHALFLSNKNMLDVKIVSERLVKIFAYHGII